MRHFFVFFPPCLLSRFFAKFCDSFFFFVKRETCTLIFDVFLVVQLMVMLEFFRRRMDLMKGKFEGCSD